MNADLVEEEIAGSFTSVGHVSAHSQTSLQALDFLQQFQTLSKNVVHSTVSA